MVGTPSLVPRLSPEDKWGTHKNTPHSSSGESLGTRLRDTYTTNARNIVLWKGESGILQEYTECSLVITSNTFFSKTHITVTHKTPGRGLECSSADFVALNKHHCNDAINITSQA